MNSPCAPPWSSQGRDECSAYRASRATSRSLGLVARNETHSRPVAIHGDTGWTRGEPSSRSVAWYTIRPLIRSRPNVARAGAAFANSAQVDITDVAYKRADLGGRPYR